MLWVLCAAYSQAPQQLDDRPPLTYVSTGDQLQRSRGKVRHHESSARALPVGAFEHECVSEPWWAAVTRCLTSSATLAAASLAKPLPWWSRPTA